MIRTESVPLPLVSRREVVALFSMLIGDLVACNGVGECTFVNIFLQVKYSILQISRTPLVVI